MSAGTDGAPRILVVDDDSNLAETCARLFRRRGYRSEVCLSAAAALEELESGREFDVVLADVRMPGLDGVELLRRCRERRFALDVVLMTGYGSIQSAVEAMRLGAADYLTKPLDRDELVRSVERLVEARRLRRAGRGSVGDVPGGFAGFVAETPPMMAVLSRAVAAAGTDSTVLIVGESGTGKELIARGIHAASRRAEGPFVPINCAALPPSLAESLLFGHRRGAFTGAEGSSEGLFVAAGGGTLFLDEVAEMPPEVQTKLLRCLEFRVVRPVGEVREIPVDVRIVAATNRDVRAAEASGSLRRDLLYRLSVVTLEVPPLRDRVEEIPALLAALARRHAADEPAIAGIDAEALAILRAHDWPGNVRELANLVEGLVATGFRGLISAGDLPSRLRLREPGPNGEALQAPGGGAAGLTLQGAEREAIRRALAASGGNKSRAAEMLGISRTSLYAKLRLYGLLS